MPGSDAQRWVFTLNNWTPEHEEILKGWFPEKVKYICYKPEVGESGTPHLQGVFVTAKRFPKGHVFGVRNGERIGFTAEIPSLHLETMRGSLGQAVKYVKKTETAAGEVVEIGIPPFNGPEKLQDQLTQIKVDVKDVSPSQLEEKYDMLDLRYPKFLAKQQMTCARFRARTLSQEGYPEVFWLFGAPGSGKTTTAIAMSKCVSDDYFVLDDNQGKVWWDGYGYQEAVILDDVDPKWIHLDFLKAVTDRARETRLPIKGSTSYLTAKFVFLTSVDHPQNIYGSAELSRRVRHLLHIGQEPPTSREVVLPPIPGTPFVYFLSTGNPAVLPPPPAGSPPAPPAPLLEVPYIDLDSE